MSKEPVVVFDCDPVRIRAEYAQLTADNVISSTLLHQPRSLAEINANRYTDVIPIESTRVVIQNTQHVQSDYINANHITVPQLECKQTDHALQVRRPYFIAGQAPLAHTMDSWWQMIVEQNVQMIVMLTKEVEMVTRGQITTPIVKADRYWPEKLNGTLTFGTIHIQMIHNDLHDTETFVHRQFLVSFPLLDRMETRTITMLHFVGWPDSKVPTDLKSFLTFYDTYHTILNSLSTSNNTPVLVHCAAGVGRTGVFCAIDAALFQLQVQNCVNVYDIVTQMRRCRCSMVQTLEQYMFIHQLIAHKITHVKK